MEPLGIQDMRFAKAEYIRALKDLRAADAELVRAEAAHEQARARYVDAMTANLNADTEYQKLLNEYQALINEARQDTNDFIAQKTASAIDSIKKEMELRELTHAKAIADAEKDLAYAQEQLRVALRNIALYSQSLTPAEQSALAAAVEIYEEAFEETSAQEIKVLRAQRTLDSLKMVREVGPDTAYDKDSKAYMGAIAKAKKDIEEKEIEQALVLALLLAVPDSLVYDDVDAWKEQIDALVEDSTELAYNQYQVKEEMANYYVNNIHDGVKVFNAMIDEFVAENGSAYPTYTAAQKKLIKEGEKTKDDFKKAPKSDSIKFAAFVKKDGEITDRSFNKFAYLLGSYDQESPYSKAATKNHIMKLNDTEDSLFIVGPVKQDMKAFILGAEGNGEKSQKGTFNKKELTANYGLWGAYSILEREMVTKKDAASDTAKLREAMEEQDSIWTAHRQILIDGLAAYEPYVEAIAQYEADVAANGAGATAMVAAIIALRDELAGVNNVADFDSFTINDSTAIFNAIVDFAKARESYLEYNPEGQPHDLDYFRYATSIVSGEPVVDSVLFSALSWDDFKAHKYDFQPSNGETPITGETPADVLALKQENGFFNIISQLLGEDIANKIFNNASTTHDSYPVTTEPGVSIKTADWNADNCPALYGLYDIDDYEDPTEIRLHGTTTEYVPSNIADDKDAIEAAIYDGTELDGYINVYNSFWAQNEDATSVDYTAYYAAVEGGVDPEDIADAKKAAEDAVIAGFLYDVDDVKGYTLATFKPYANEAPIVCFTNGVSVDTTDAMKAILTAVDPETSSLTNNTQWDGDIFESRSAIFNAGATDFWNFMYAAYNYYEAVNEKIAQDLEYIKKWIQGVESTFVADATVDDGTAGYNQWKTDYAAAKEAKEAYDEYDEALKAFTGVDEDGEALGIVGPLTDPSAATVPGEEFKTISSVLMPVLVEPVTVYGYYPGEWSENLGGAQLAAAQVLFPEYPEKIAEWDETIKDTEDELLHYATLIQAAKKAYFAAAKIADENVDNATNWDELVENYKKANENYRNRLLGIIEDLQTEIETLEQRIAKFNQGLPQLDIAIAEAEQKVKVETARLEGYKEALAYAKANLDKLMEYLKGLDVNFVVPAIDVD